MQIQFKQNEIEAAIRGYIVKQGISLKEREVSITFTAGRGGNGLSAEATISEFVMPSEEETLIEPMYEPMDEPKAIPIGPINRAVINPDIVKPEAVPSPVFAHVPEAKVFDVKDSDKPEETETSSKALVNLFG